MLLLALCGCTSAPKAENARQAIALDLVRAAEANDLDAVERYTSKASVGEIGGPSVPRSRLMTILTPGKGDDPGPCALEHLNGGETDDDVVWVSWDCGSPLNKRLVHIHFTKTEITAVNFLLGL